MITIRPGTDADVDMVRTLARDAFALFVQRTGRAPAAMAADYAGLTRAGHVRVVLEDERIVGFAVARPEQDHLVLQTLAVSADTAGRGVGSVLLLHVEALAVTLRLSEVRLSANEAMTESLEFFSRRGYTEADRDAENGVQLSKHL